MKTESKDVKNKLEDDDEDDDDVDVDDINVDIYANSSTSVNKTDMNVENLRSEVADKMEHELLNLEFSVSFVFLIKVNVL